ncbi:MAG TPA: helix-turn-helix domain-containing protein, partial [Xanthomonadaceae bacterium]|nr:helix-turn-helix domain-containing protein [Xanthomonadaceae bacterium]
CTFYEFVNLHRIEAVKRELLDGSRPMLDLALEAGFSNKSTFNKVFKEHTGQTPSAFRRAGNTS